ncbi:hypothetical protein ALC62_15179 [Cyphomyrmex costatus]|uniref:Uncharacterized protein n=1 Tax=Cyphomyrmex costatus TaxID=456900 RepID=A0A151I7U2_9HYME|nr:hypothetical protein ALC62_15179 [Cyphomyrmex costatus]
MRLKGCFGYSSAPCNNPGASVSASSAANSGDAPASSNLLSALQTPSVRFNSMSEARLFPSNMSYLKSHIRDALDLVSKYDGYNIPVWQFTRACKRAKESIPSVDKTQLVRMLRNKLLHHAYLAVEDETHLSVDKFLDTLKRIFGPGRNSNYYRGQLSNAYKKPSEHVLDYIGSPLKDLRTAIIEGDQAIFDRPCTELEISSIDSFTLESFFEGLPREYRVELRAEGYRNFADACSKVIAIHKRLEREDSRYRGSANSRNNQARACHTWRLPFVLIRSVHTLRRDDGNIPVIELVSFDFRSSVAFMLDTGAQLSNNKERMPQ